MGRIKAVLNERRMAYAEALKILHARWLREEHAEMALDDPIVQAVLHDAWEETDALRQRRQAILDERHGLTEAADPVASEPTEASGLADVPAVVESAPAADSTSVPATVETQSGALDTPAEPEWYDEEEGPQPRSPPTRTEENIAKLRALAAEMLPPALPKLSLEGSRKHRQQLSLEALEKRFVARQQAQAMLAARRRQRDKAQRRVAELVALGAARSSAPSAHV